MKKFLSLPIIVVFSVPLALASVINVPSDQPTIQAGINAAVNGDTVLVAPGTYTENISFMGKAIIVKSSLGNKVTIIDGGHAGSVVAFDSGEGRKSVLHGFTIQNGSAPFFGGGVYISFASPTVTGNIITNNTATSGGGGMEVQFSSALVQGNTIMNNSQTRGYSGGDGGGIEVEGAGSAQIIGNTIQNNTWNSGCGGGIGLFGAGTPTIKNNIIRGNVAAGISPASQGGGIWIVNDSNALIIQNLIYANSAPQGAGIYFGVPYGSRGPLFVNNTVVGTASSPEGSAVYATGYDDQVQFFNNIMIGQSGQNAVYCDTAYSQQPPTFTNNDAYSPGGTGLQGTCAAQSAQNGNMSANPIFISTTNLRLQAGSPAIDAGDNVAPDLPAKDLAGNPRVINGNDLPTALVDMGAYEFVPVVLSPNSLNYGLQAVGSSTSKTVTLANKQNKALTITAFSVPAEYSLSGCGVSVAAFSSCTLTVTFNPLTSGTFNGTLNVTDDAGNSPQTVTVSGSAH